MAGRPDSFMPFYVGDYLADTGHLAPLEHAAYLLLIFHYWRTGSTLPSDDVTLARIARMNSREWRMVKGAVLAFFQRVTINAIPVYAHKRIERELASASQRYELQMARTEAATRARNGKRDVQRDVQRDDGRDDERNEVLTTTITTTNKEKSISSDEPSDPPTENLKSANGHAHKPLRYPPDFENFWREYPTDKLMSKKSAAAQWSRLCDEDQRLAAAAITGFRAYCRENPDYRPVHAERFLSQRRFDGFNESAAAPPINEFVRRIAEAEAKAGD